jgi:trk system potassium uptake protein
MRIVFCGAGPMTVITARSLIEEGHDVIIIENDKASIDRLAEDMDASLVHGDAAKPDILRQVNPKDCDFLFCLTSSDEVNVITALLGRSMGFKRVVPSIENAELQQLCRELGLEDTIIPVRTMSRHLENMVRGLDSVELSTVLKSDARLFTFVAGKEEVDEKGALDLPENTRALFYYRDDGFNFIDEETRFKNGDEIVLLTHSEHLPELKDRWQPKQADTKD